MNTLQNDKSKELGSCLPDKKQLILFFLFSGLRGITFAVTNSKQVPFFELYKQVVIIFSISKQFKRTKDIVRMILWMKKWLSIDYKTDQLVY